MNTKTTKGTATTIIWVEERVYQVDNSRENEIINTERLTTGEWVAEITLPLLNKTLTAKGETEGEAMEKVAQLAHPLIEEYIEQHPELKKENKIKDLEYEYECDENGKLKTIGITNESMLKVQQITEKIDKQIFDQLVEGVKKIFGPQSEEKTMFFKTIKLDSNDKGKGLDKILNEQTDKTAKEYKTIEIVSHLDAKNMIYYACGYMPRRKFATTKAKIQLNLWRGS